MSDSSGPSSPRPAAPLSESDDRLWASLAHLGGILSFLPSLIIWLVFKDRGAFTDREAKEALNFQITLVIVQIGLSIVIGIISFVTFGLGSVLGFLNFAVYVAGIVLCVIAFLKTKDGIAYRYPFAIRLIR